MSEVRDNGPVADERAPELRAGDSDRDRVAAKLRESLVAGRLTLDEFSERLDAAYGARTLAELEELTRDLPESAALPAVASRRTPTRWTVAVMSGVERKSRWRLPAKTTAIAVMGGIELDLRKAEIESQEVEIIAVAVMGGIEIIIPEGVEVDLTGFAFMGAKEDRMADAPVLPGAPLIRVRAFAFMGGIEVRSKRGSARAISPPVPEPPRLPR
jgi:DUF1707 SHOCT-like domain/Cell wall-active antibiotics response LiaF, C-terminal